MDPSGLSVADQASGEPSETETEVNIGMEPDYYKAVQGILTKKFQPVRNKTNRENTRQRKQSHTQDNIYVVRQFAYIHGVAGISL